MGTRDVNKKQTNRGIILGDFFKNRTKRLKAVIKIRVDMLNTEMSDL